MSDLRGWIEEQKKKGLIQEGEMMAVRPTSGGAADLFRRTI